MEISDYLIQIDKEYNFTSNEYLIFDDLYEYVSNTKRYLHYYEFLRYCNTDKSILEFAERYYFLCKCLILEHNAIYKEDD